MQVTHTNVSRDELRELLAHMGAPCVSLFLAAYQPSETQQRLIQLENLLRRAETELAAVGQDPRQIEALLAPAWKLMDPMALEEYQAHSLALYLAPGAFRMLERPQALESQVFIGALPYIKPLCAPVAAAESFYLLAISKSQVRLLHAAGDGVVAISLPGAPKNLEDALRNDTHGRQMQRQVTAAHGGAGGAMYPGHGGEVDQKAQLQQYLQQISDAVTHVLQREREPLILAGVDYLLALYRQVNSYAYLLEATILGSPDHLSDEALCAQAAALLESRAALDPADEAQRFHQLAAYDPPRASANLRVILPAAHAGRVARLLVAGDRRVSGRYDEREETISLHATPLPGDEDLLDVAAWQTLLHGGEVITALADQIPGGAEVAALFRY